MKTLHRIHTQICKKCRRWTWKHFCTSFLLCWWPWWNKIWAFAYIFVSTFCFFRCIWFGSTWMVGLHFCKDWWLTLRCSSQLWKFCPQNKPLRCVSCLNSILTIIQPHKWVIWNTLHTSAIDFKRVWRLHVAKLMASCSNKQTLKCFKI